MASRSRWIVLFSLLIVSAVVDSADYYQYDGRGNNLIHDEWGATDQLYLRQQTPAMTGYGSTGDTSTAFATSARDISVGLSIPAYRNRQRNVLFKTDMLTYLGQFFGLDIALNTKGEDISGNRFDVIIAECDWHFNKAKCIPASTASPTSFPFIRSESTVYDGIRQQINSVTAFLDGSGVYGSDAQTAEKLRARYRGRLLTYNGELPKNTFGVSMENPSNREINAQLRAAGNPHANMNPILLAIQSLFVREHNRLADQFYEEHSNWSDERLYQEARMWNVAFMQSICFHEYLPLLGVELPAYTGYKSTINPGIDNFFATVAFRYGHAEVNDVIARVNDDGEEIADGSIILSMSQYFPSYALSTGIEPILRGASFTRQAAVAPHFASALQNYLFNVPAHGGADLLAVNIQRGRDHGIPTYNEARSSLGMVRVQSFRDITSDVYLQRQLEAVYGNVDNVEAYAGGCAEDLYRGSSIGQLFYGSILEQFGRIRDGDRFYFENSQNGLFTREQQDEIKRIGLRDIILRNTDIKTLPENIYITNAEEPWPQERQTAAEIEDGNTLPVGRATLRSGEYDIEWEPETIAGVSYLRFELMCRTEGWIGIGIAQDPSSAMVNADIMLARFLGGQASIGDYWATSFSQPALDTSQGGTNNVELISGSHISGMSSVEFRRRVHANDVYDQSINTAGETPVIYAWHSTSQDLVYHTPLRRGKTSIDFFGPFRGETTPMQSSPSQPSSTPAPTPISTSGGAVVIDASKEMRFAWSTEMIDGREWISATMSMKGRGPQWMGIGIEGPEGGLVEADLVKVTANGNGGCSVRDYWAQSDSEISLDTSLGGNDDSIASFCYISGDTFDFEFKRRLDTGDSFDRPFSKNAYTDVIFAFDDSTMTINPQTITLKRLRIDVLSASWMEPQEIMTVTPTTDPVETAPPTSPAISTPTADTEPVNVPSSPVTDTSPASTTGEVILDEGASFVLGYELFREEIVFTMTFTGQGFSAIGIPGATPNMIEADVIAAVSDGSGGCTVGDYWSTSFVAPVDDASNGGSMDLTDVECSIDGDTMHATFTRKLSTGDSSDRDITPETISLIYAFATTAGGLQYHGPMGRGSTEIKPDLSVFQATEKEPAEPDGAGSTSEGGTPDSAEILGTPAVPSTPQGADLAALYSKLRVFLAHTFLSGMGVLLFSVASAVLEHVARGWRQWRTVHYGSLICADVIIFVAEILALAWGNGRVTFAHTALAYVLVFAAPIQAGISTYTFPGNRPSSAWKKLARVVNVVVLALGVCQFRLALRILGAGNRAFQLLSAYVTSIAAILLFVTRSADHSQKQLPVTAEREKKDEEEEDQRPAKSQESNPGKKSSVTFDQNLVSYEARKSIVAKAVSRKSELPMASFRPSLASRATIGPDGLFSITSDDFQEQIDTGRLWTVIDDKIYNMEDFMSIHPGGVENIEDIIGKDGTDLFMEAHEDSNSAKELLNKYQIGTLNSE